MIMDDFEEMEQMIQDESDVAALKSWTSSRTSDCCSNNYVIGSCNAEICLKTFVVVFVRHRSNFLRKCFITHTHGKIEFFFNLSMSVCDEKFFVRINVYHSDDVILFKKMFGSSVKRSTKKMAFMRILVSHGPHGCTISW